jgi:hypothetical protein
MRGFTFGSPLTVHYGDRVVGRAVASATGAANATVRVPITDESRYHLIVNDQDGATASVTAVTPAGLRYSVEPPPTGHAGHHWSARTRFRRVRVWGADFKPHRPVRLYSRDRVVGGARARTNGSVSWVVRLPEDRLAHARIIAVGHGGRLAVAKAMDSTPHLAFAAIGPTAHLAGRGYEPDTRVTLTYAHRVVGFTHTNSRGAFTYHLDLPRWTRPADPLAATDPMGRTAIVTGLVRR